MKTFSSIVAIFALTTSGAVADPGDVRIGGFSGVWCGYPADFSIEQRHGGDWVFDGNLIFPTYNNHSDRLWIEQYGDQSLRMIRYLSGPDAGKTQVVTTFPPRMHSNGSAEFKAQIVDGPDCRGKSTHFEIK